MRWRIEISSNNNGNTARVPQLGSYAIQCGGDLVSPTCLALKSCDFTFGHVVETESIGTVWISGEMCAPHI